MENEALKDYEIGEWILYAIGEYNLGIGEISGFEVKGNKPEDITIRMRVWTGPNYNPKASDVLCNVSKKGTHEAYLVWRARKISLVDCFKQTASQFTAEAFNTVNRSYNCTLRDYWDDKIDNFIEVSANMVKVYAAIEVLKENLKEEEDGRKG